MQPLVLYLQYNFIASKLAVFWPIWMYDFAGIIQVGGRACGFGGCACTLFGWHWKGSSHGALSGWLGWQVLFSASDGVFSVDCLLSGNSDQPPILRSLITLAIPVALFALCAIFWLLWCVVLSCKRLLPATPNLLPDEER